MHVCYMAIYDSRMLAREGRMVAGEGRMVAGEGRMVAGFRKWWEHMVRWEGWLLG